MKWLVMLVATLICQSPCIGASVTPVHAPTEAATWVVDPALPGDNLPPSGQSLFDRLFSTNDHSVVRERGSSGYAIPYPFAALLSRLDSQLEHDPHSQLPPAKRVLIPLGRSLQRSAAAPDYFAFPRVVAAADAPPANPTALFLKDRLYIGYQEKSDVLEVISYNETAGRFEFQLVRDYRAGVKPQVIYANRTLCFACHQNGAPIFSRALWDETNANPKIAAQLAATGKDFYGISLTRGVDVPYAIDIGIRRANDFALVQWLWREGCGGNEIVARRCRAGLLTSALRHALADDRKGFHDPEFDETIAKPLLAQAAQRWPGGLAVATSDLPNRNPLQGIENWPDDAQQGARHGRVAAAFDPLLPRPAGDIWRATAANAIDRLVGGLAGFIAETDRRLLAGALTRQPAAMREWRIPCRFDIRASRWAARCQPAPGENGPALQATLVVERGEISGGRIERLSLPDSDGINGVVLTRNRGQDGRHRALVPADGHDPRGADGNPLVRIAFLAASDSPANGEANGEAIVEFRQEFPTIAQAVAALVEGAKSEALFGDHPFPREAIISALLTELGSPAPIPCCGAEAHLPAPRSDSALPPLGRSTTTTTPPAARDFAPYCATCHQSDDHFPPNFLAGNDEQVAARLRQCAPRLFVRLSMPDLAPDQRDKTPMPPESLLPAFGTDPAGWRSSPVRAALLAKVGEWLRDETGKAADLKQLLAGGYEALRPCLPDRP